MKCTFCGEEVKKGKGKIFVKKNGKSSYYCSSKCEKNHQKLGRNPKKTNWVKED